MVFLQLSKNYKFKFCFLFPSFIYIHSFIVVYSKINQVLFIYLFIIMIYFSSTPSIYFSYYFGSILFFIFLGIHLSSTNSSCCVYICRCIRSKSLKIKSHNCNKNKKCSQVKLYEIEMSVYIF